MTLQACSKCLRIKYGGKWSPNPSSQMKLGRKDVEYFDGCPLCLGETQCEDPKDDPEDSGTDSSVDVRPGAQEEPKEADVQEEAGPPEGGGTKKDDSGQAETTTPARTTEPSDTPKPRKPGRLEREAQRREAKYRAERCEKPETDRPHFTKSIVPSADLDEALGQVAHEHHQALVQCRKIMGQALLEFCSHLKAIRDQELYKFYAHDTFKEYLATPEVDIDDSRARRLIQLIETKDRLEKQLGHTVDIEGIPEYRLTRGLLPCLDVDRKTGEIKNIEVAEELIEQARTLGCNDWSAEVERKKLDRPGGGGKRPIPELLIEANAMLVNAENNPIGVVVTARADETHHTLKIKIDNGYITDDMVIRIK